MTLALIKSDRNEVLQGAETEGCAPFDTTATSHGGDKEPCPGLQMSEWDSSEDDLSRTANYLQLNSVFAGAVNT